MKGTAGFRAVPFALLRVLAFMLRAQALFIDSHDWLPLAQCKESALMFHAECTNVTGFSSSCSPVFIRAEL
jgi:hypothetical protein